MCNNCDECKHFYEREGEEEFCKSCTNYYGDRFEEYSPNIEHKFVWHTITKPAETGRYIVGVKGVENVTIAYYSQATKLFYNIANPKSVLIIHPNNQIYNVICWAEIPELPE